MKCLKTNRGGLTTLTTSYSHPQQWEWTFPFAAPLLGWSLFVFGSVGGFAAERAEANPDEQNSWYVQNVSLEDTPAVIHVTLENVSEDKDIDAVNIQPTSGSMSLDLEGHVQCSPDLYNGGYEDEGVGQMFSHAFAFWGTVHLIDDAVVPTEALHVASYDPTVWVKYLPHKWSEQAGNFDPFVVPLAAIYDGSSDIRFRPVEEFNQIMEDWLQASGGSRVSYLSQDRYFTVMRPISLSGYCEDQHTGLEGGGYETVLMPIHVKYEGDPGLILANPPDDLVLPFEVTSASVTTKLEDVDYVGACPVSLDFRVNIFTTSGEGWVQYRFVDKLGNKGPIWDRWVDGGFEEWYFDKFVGVKKDQPNGGNHGNLGDKAILDSVKQNNSWRIEIVSPNSLTSDEHFYYWTCFEQTIDGSPDGYSVEADEPQGEEHVTVTGRVAN